MPNHKPESGAQAFAERLVKLLADNGRPRHGAGAYLAKKYKVATVTANAWLNGEHKADIPTSRRIAHDHGTTFEVLYFGADPTGSLDPQLQRPDPAILLRSLKFLDTAYAFQSKSFDIRTDAELFADAYAWLAEGDKSEDQRSLVHFAQWLERRRTGSGKVATNPELVDPGHWKPW